MSSSNKPVLLLAESKRARFSSDILQRDDIDVVLLRLGEESHRVSQFGTAAQVAEPSVPVFVLNEQSTLDTEALRYKNWLSSIEREPTFFCNPNEAVQPTAQAFARKVGLPFLTPKQVAQVHDKPAMKDLYSVEGICHAPYKRVSTPSEVRDAASEFGWPLILKPVDSDACVGTYKIEGPESSKIAEVENQTYQWIVEKYIRGREFQLCALVFAGNVLDAFISANPAPILDTLSGGINANITLAPSEQEPIDSVALSQRLVDAVGYDHGYLHAEFFLTEEGIFVMGELAARLSGCEVPLNHGLSYGFDIMRAIGDLYVGRRPKLDYTANRSVGDLLLPVQAGVVREVTPVADLIALPGVISCNLNYGVGDTAIVTRSSSSCSGVVQVEGATSAEVHERMLHVLEQYTFSVALS